MIEENHQAPEQDLAGAIRAARKWLRRTNSGPRKKSASTSSCRRPRLKVAW